MDKRRLIAPNVVDLAHSVIPEQRAQHRGRRVQREADREWGVAALENEVTCGERFGRLSADRDAGLQNEEVVEVSGVELAERGSHLLLSHRERKTFVRPESSSPSLFSKLACTSGSVIGDRPRLALAPAGAAMRQRLYLKRPPPNHSPSSLGAAMLPSGSAAPWRRIFGSLEPSMPAPGPGGA